MTGIGRAAVAGAGNEGGAHAGGARRIEFLDDVGEKQDLIGRQIDGAGNAGIRGGFALGSRLGIEIAGKNRRQVTFLGMREKQFLGRYRTR